MGKSFVLGVAIAAGYALGYSDARKHPDHIVVRAVQQARTIFGGTTHNDVDAVMTRIEGQN